MKSKKINFNLPKNKQRLSNLLAALHEIKNSSVNGRFTGPTVNILCKHKVNDYTGMNVTLQNERVFTRLKQRESVTFLTFPSNITPSFAKLMMQRTQDARIVYLIAYKKRKEEEEIQNAKKDLEFDFKDLKQPDKAVLDINVDFEQVTSKEKRTCNTDAETALNMILNFIIQRRAFPSEMKHQTVEQFITTSKELAPVWKKHAQEFLSIKLTA